MSDAAWALQTARQVGPIHPPRAHPHPIHKLHTGPLHSHVAGRTDHLPSNVPNGAYVLPADIVSALGEGNTMAGFKIAKRMFEGAGRHFDGTPYAGDNGPYGQGNGLPYGHAKGGQITIGRNEKQTTVGPGYEEWQTQPSGGVPDPQNSVTGPTMPQGPSFQEQLEDNRNRQDIIDQHVGTPLADGGMAANPAFNNWFSGSRVVDENGAPAPQYHSTTGDFSTFRTGPGNGLKLMDGLGAHFGTAEAANQRFRKNYGKAPPPGGNVMPVYLSIKKPLTKKDGSPMNEGELQSHLSKVASQIGIDKNKHRAYSAAYPMRGDIYRQLKDELVRRGYDGIPYVNSHEDRGSTSWIAFHPNQIKSATGNQGTFDPSNPDITKASGGSVDQGVPVAVAGGEHVLAPHEVMFAGMGDLDAGHRALDDFVIRQRAKTVKTLKGLPGPKRD